jgi:hypothetical protein
VHALYQQLPQLLRHHAHKLSSSQPVVPKPTWLASAKHSHLCLHQQTVTAAHIKLVDNTSNSALS